MDKLIVKRGRPFKHGMTNKRVYRSWGGMIQRCLNKNNPAYKNYGGRGIKICDRWLTFENFFEDMGERPAGKSLDRFPNNDKGYCKSNCRWATPTEQQNNTRIKDNKIIKLERITKMLKKIIAKIKKIDDEVMLNPNQILDMGIVLNTKLEPSTFLFYRMLRRKEIKSINLGTEKSPKYFIKGKNLKEFLLKRYNLI